MTSEVVFSDNAHGEPVGKTVGMIYSRDCAALSQPAAKGVHMTGGEIRGLRALYARASEPRTQVDDRNSQG